MPSDSQCDWPPNVSKLPGMAVQSFQVQQCRGRQRRRRLINSLPYGNDQKTSAEICACLCWIEYSDYSSHAVWRSGCVFSWRTAWCIRDHVYSWSVGLAVGLFVCHLMFFYALSMFLFWQVSFICYVMPLSHSMSGCRRRRALFYAYSFRLFMSWR